MREEVHVIASGIVQGVFFRRTVCQHAQPLGLVGTVSNLPDGTVEIVAQGEREVLERFVKGLERAPGAGRIERLEIRYSAPKKRYSGFQVV